MCRAGFLFLRGIMHISEGVLSGPVLISGAALTAAGTAIGLKKLDYDRIAQAALLAAAFFVASLIHVPVGPSSVHLIMNGMVGLFLGWGAFPTILVALVLQGVLFQFGGITTLGVNTVIMAAPPVACYYLFGRLIHKDKLIGAAAAFACGFLSVALAAVLMAAALVFTEEGFWAIAATVIVTNLPVMIIEGLVAVSGIAFIKKVKPDLLPQFIGGENSSSTSKHIKT
jgi:cobalt/nickel transport system permease protein